MTSKEVTRRPAGALAVEDGQAHWKDVQLAALRQAGLENAPAADLDVFLHQAQRTGLDPFARQIYMIGRKDSSAPGGMKYTIQAAIDGLRIVAERHGKYGGQEGPQWCGEDGVWRDVWVAKSPPIAARVGIIRHDWKSTIWATAMFHEFAGTKYDGSLNVMWKTKSAHMIAKCAEALALRKAFPQDLSGVYIAEEMDRAEPVTVPSERVPGPAGKPEREAIDWDAKIAEAAGDPAALRAVWDLAKGIEPNNLALAERLAAAGKAAAEAAVAVETPAPTFTDGIVDAEIVDEPAAEPPADEPTEMADDAQLQQLAIQFGEADVKERADRLAVISLMLNDRYTTMKDLTAENATYVSNRIKTLSRAGTFADTVTRALAAAQSTTEGEADSVA